MSPVNEELVDRISADLEFDRELVFGTIKLMDEGCTVPFIARYRKEISGTLGFDKIQSIESRYSDYQALRARKRTILKYLKKMDKLVPELESRIETCDDKAALEDINLPYKIRKESIALAAESKGLRTYAEQVLVFDPPADVNAIFEQAVAELEDVTTVDEAREGIRNILAELFAEDADLRGRIRELARKEGAIVSSVVPGREETSSRFQNFYAFSEPATTIPSHRLLAIRRGEKEGYLNMSLDFDRNKMVEIVEDRILLGDDENQRGFLREVSEFAADHLLKPSIAREVKAETKRRADLESIAVFSENLSDMLLAPPVGSLTTIGVDPGNRTGTRLAVVDGEGRYLDSAVLFLNDPEDTAKVEESKETLKNLLKQHTPRFIAVGNGTTSRAAEKVLRSLLAGLEGAPELVMINEAGVSVYAASDAAKDELPNQDVAVRAAVSMARRIQDPLAELVKIDPRSIGVGQYQHDVNQTLLREALQKVVSASVNLVGVTVNTASVQLLSYVSGLNYNLAEAIVEHCKQNGPFVSNARLMDVKGIGAKTFEQCAGFLRIPDSEIPLDNMRIHPESYHIVERMAQDLGKALDELLADPSALDGIDPERYCDEKAQLPTIRDILEELKKPGRDPRGTYQSVHFRDDVTDVKDLQVGMVLEGRVSNVTRFGAFVDVGVHHDGLVHISEISNRFVSDPSEVVHVGQVVKVKVIGVELDENRTRVSLSMKLEERKAPRQRSQRGGGGGQDGGGGKAKRKKQQRAKLRTLDDLLNRFGDPRKPRIDDNNNN